MRRAIIVGLLFSSAFVFGSCTDQASSLGPDEDLFPSARFSDYPCGGGTCTYPTPDSHGFLYNEANRLLTHSNSLCNAVGASLTFMLVDHRMGIRNEGPSGNTYGQYNTFYPSYSAEDQFPTIGTFGESGEWSVAHPDNGSWIASSSQAQMIQTARHEAAHGIFFNSPSYGQQQVDDFPHHGAPSAYQVTSTCG